MLRSIGDLPPLSAFCCVSSELARKATAVKSNHQMIYLAKRFDVGAATTRVFGINKTDGWMKGTPTASKVVWCCDSVWITAFRASPGRCFPDPKCPGEGPLARILSNSRAFKSHGPASPTRAAKGTRRCHGSVGKSQLKRFGSFFGLKLGYYYRVVGKLL